MATVGRRAPSGKASNLFCTSVFLVQGLLIEPVCLLRRVAVMIPLVVLLGWCSGSRRCAVCVGMSSDPTPWPVLLVLSLFGVARIWCFTCNLVNSSVFLCECAALCCKLGSAPCTLSSFLALLI